MTDATPVQAEAGHFVPNVDNATPGQAPAASIDDGDHDGAALATSDDHASPAGPSFIQPVRRAPARRVPAWQWATLALLAAALGVQMLIADRGRLAQDALWRPVLERTCGLLRCSLPAWHQPQAYTMLAREVKPVPGVPGVLQVRASFRNDARWPQHWPTIALSLSDADGRIAGARMLVPADYLEPPQRDAVLAPGQSGQMTVQVREPAGGVVAFAFDFR